MYSGCKQAVHAAYFVCAACGPRRRSLLSNAIRAFPIAAATIIVICLLATGQARTQEMSSPEEVRTIEFGKEIYKNKASCQFCHKWDASGDQGYGGNALSLRKTHLTPEQFAEVVKCGRPLTGMPYHDRLSYTDKRCYDMTRKDLGKDMPPMGEFLQAREIGAVVKYLFAKVVGREATTYEDCIDFWGSDTRQCEPYKK
jgi:mono/diheme cytochrome c family protein